MLIKAIKAWSEFEQCRRRFRKAFASADSREQRERVEATAIRLLVWHIERGHTLETVEAMIDTPNSPHITTSPIAQSLPRATGEQPV